MISEASIGKSIKLDVHDRLAFVSTEDEINRIVTQVNNHIGPDPTEPVSLTAPTVTGGSFSSPTITAPTMTTPTVTGAVTTDTSYKVGANQVVSARNTGWDTPTGSESKATFDPSTVTLPDLGERVAALINALRTHGLIGS